MQMLAVPGVVILGQVPLAMIAVLVKGEISGCAVGGTAGLGAWAQTM